MNQIEKMLLVCAVVGLGGSVHAVTADRYETIIDRNIFRLNPTPIATGPTNTEPVLERKVDLSGISNIGGNKKAWFVVSPKAGSKDSPLYLNLAEGQRQDFLEVVSISDLSGEVKVVNAGNSMVLSLKTNILKPQPVAPLAPGIPAVPVATAGLPAAIPPQPGVDAYTGGAAASYAGGTSAYASRGAVTVSGGAPVVSSGAGQPADSNSGLRTIPTRTLRLAPVANQAPPANEKPVDPVTQRVLMELQQEQAKRTGQALPPIPPLPQ